MKGTPLRRSLRVDAARAAGFAAACVMLTMSVGCAPMRDDATAAPTLSATPTSGASAAGPLAPAMLPGWSDDDLHDLRRALVRQCALARPPQPWPALCPQVPGADDLKHWISSRFDAWPLAGADGSLDGLLTGYYEPILHGTRTRVHASQVPLYARPADLVALADGSRRRLHDGRPVGAYPSRAQIENEGLPAAETLLWIDDPIEAFFLHVQGSGRVRLPDGEVVRVGYADHNGHAYRAIGRELIERGAMKAEEVDAASIRAWLRANPRQARAVLHSNPRYIFFRELHASTTPADSAGPPGSLGVALTPMRSVATDPSFVPPGALLFVDGSHPDSGAPLRRAVVSQDRGAAIVGAVRADLFWGSGDEAGRLAGLARQPMRMWLLWPKGTRPPGR